MNTDKKALSEKEKEERRKKRERELDEQIEQSFPASDPPSYSKPGNEDDDDKDEKDK